MDYLASAVGIAVFTLFMSLWVHAPVQAAQLTPFAISSSGAVGAAR